MPCAPEMLADVELFEHLSDEDRAGLAQFIDFRELAAGTALFHAGQPGDAMYVVKRGEIELYIKDTTGQKIALNIARPGELFGELALLDYGPRTATAVALEDSELLELDRDDLLRLFKSTPQAALRLLAADPAPEALLSGEDEFAALPQVMARLAADPGPTLCHRIRY